MKVYLSHKIRGDQGKNASNVYMKKNCDKAIEIANKIRKAISSLEIYCPGEHEFPLVNLIIRKNYLTIEQILEIDCSIIDRCDAVIVYVPEGDRIQGGRWIEYQYAKEHHKPIWKFSDVDDIINRLAQYIIRQ